MTGTNTGAAMLSLLGNMVAVQEADDPPVDLDVDILRLAETMSLIPPASPEDPKS